LAQDLKSRIKKLAEWVRPDPPGPTPLTTSEALALLERDRFTDLLTYREVDEERNLVLLDDGSGPAVGFILGFSPLMAAGMDSETQFEAVFNACPADTIVQFGKLVTPAVDGFIDTWTDARLKDNKNPLLRQIAMRRKEFMLTTASGPSMLPKTRLHPRMMQWYCSVRVPFKGDYTDKAEIAAFMKSASDLRNSIMGALKSAMCESTALDEQYVRFLLRELLNPHLGPAERVNTANLQVPMHKDLVDPATRLNINMDGSIGFAKEVGTPDVVVTTLTVDATPRIHALPAMAQTLGNPLAWDERITCPYWAYTTVHILDAEDAKDSLTAKFGLLNKQTASESPWFRSMMGYLYERRDMAGALLEETRKGHRLVRCYTGINLYTAPEEARAQAEEVKGFYRRAGFRISQEPYISLPVFVASLPLQYTPAMDPPNRGMQRAQLMSSLNASTLLQIQGDWRGTEPGRSYKPDGSVDKLGAGPLMVSRAGQVACFNLLQTTSNYNFVIVAASGSGKSFLANEIICDFLSKGGMARIVDVGRSYYRFCSVMGGQNIVFSPDNPMSLNPFTGIKTTADLDEMMPMLKDLLRQMAFQLTPEELTPSWEYAAIEDAITQAWMERRENTELVHITEVLEKMGDARAADVAYMLKPFATGRYKQWFAGKRSVSFDKPLVVIELEELKQDANLQAVVLQLVMYQVTKEMYLTDRKIPKLLAIDEAWDLMGGLKTGKFIETSFRRARKYNGIAGVITQSFEDFEKSDAARASIENAAWQFVLYQRPESIEFAVANKRIVGSEGTVDLIRSVRSGDGFSEVFVRSETAGGLYRFVTDKHTYYTFTTNPKDINRLDRLVDSGMTMAEAIDKLANEDYEKMWGVKAS
jgi:conjugal transfer ATP-binding protein TraC